MDYQESYTLLKGSIVDLYQHLISHPANAKQQQNLGRESHLLGDTPLLIIEKMRNLIDGLLDQGKIRLDTNGSALSEQSTSAATEEQMRKYESDIRQHIAVEQQLKVYIDSLKHRHEQEIKELREECRRVKDRADEDKDKWDRECTELKEEVARLKIQQQRGSSFQYNPISYRSSQQLEQVPSFSQLLQFHGKNQPQQPLVSHTVINLYQNNSSIDGASSMRNHVNSGSFYQDKVMKGEEVISTVEDDTVQKQVRFMARKHSEYFTTTQTPLKQTYTQPNQNKTVQTTPKRLCNAQMNSSDKPTKIQGDQPLNRRAKSSLEQVSRSVQMHYLLQTQSRERSMKSIQNRKNSQPIATTSQKVPQSSVMHKPQQILANRTQNHSPEQLSARFNKSNGKQSPNQMRKVRTKLRNSHSGVSLLIQTIQLIKSSKISNNKGRQVNK
ncbi:hypothetical protein FGO68_gene2362 [Halteria grandinella]|uniref:Uncharacterized protein n=1 Tax=Halteria grandinella TaxID=5974 RepID=A0A8J8NMQ8_HALGN|nr:hypothetical protein FGO68_gene2362 [Halteria grandinella]